MKNIMTTDEKLTMTPFWPDRCKHTRPNDRFLGTFDLDDGVYDVFVYQDNALSSSKSDMHICIRYGDKGNEYISPGNAKDFVDRFAVKAGNSKVYRLTLPFIQKWLSKTKKR